MIPCNYYICMTQYSILATKDRSGGSGLSMSGVRQRLGTPFPWRMTRLIVAMQLIIAAAAVT
jgi:hypothetical protein